MKATEQYFPMVEFIMLYKVFLTFEFVDKILRCDHLNESYQVVYFPVVLFIVWYIRWFFITFESVDEILKCDLKMKATEQYFPRVLFILLYKVVLSLSLRTKFCL